MPLTPYIGKTARLRSLTMMNGPRDRRKARHFRVAGFG